LPLENFQVNIKNLKYRSVVEHSQTK